MHPPMLRSLSVRRLVDLELTCLFVDLIDTVLSIHSHTLSSTVLQLSLAQVRPARFTLSIDPCWMLSLHES